MKCLSAVLKLISHEKNAPLLVSNFVVTNATEALRPPCKLRLLSRSIWEAKSLRLGYRLLTGPRAASIDEVITAAKAIAGLSKAATFDTSDLGQLALQ